MTVVEIDSGRVRGVERDGVHRFLGIPYAASPAGTQRFRPPQPVEPWVEVRECVAAGPIAPQPPAMPGLAIPGDPEIQDEDCLTVNVFTPQVLGSRPVLVWIHGGAFVTGTGASAVYDGTHLAARGDLVVVTCNYRLGALGFLGDPALVDPSAPGLGNYGLLDQLAVLRWVQRNIAAFGGDPSAVTLFGESAGAMSASTLWATPAARGLFQRLILQSGPPYVHRREQAVAAAATVAEELGLTAPTRADWEAVPAQDLVAAVQRMSARPVEPGQVALPLLPVVDGVLLETHPLEAVAEGRVPAVPLLCGTTRDEMALFSLGDPSTALLDADALQRLVERHLPSVPAAEALERVAVARAGRGEAIDPRSLWVALATEDVFRFPTLRLAAAHQRHQPSTFVYLFTQPSPLLGGALGSCHALELPFVFGTAAHDHISLFCGSGPDVDRLVDQMGTAWARFATAGDPSHPGIGTWDRFDPDRRATMVFGPEGGLAENPRGEELAVFDDAFGLVGPRGT